jgi:membrane dipeptidase
MVKNSHEPEYKSFSYLEEGKDFKHFDLANEIDRVKSRKLSVTGTEIDRMEKIFLNFPSVSMHDHPFILPVSLEHTYEYIKRNRISFGYRGLFHSRLSAVFDGLLNSFNLIHSDRPWRWDSVIDELGMRLCDLSHQDFATLCRSISDIIDAHKTRRIAIIPHLEGASMIENDLDRIDILFGLGVRCIGLVYSESNYLGSGFKEKRDGGLTDFGHDAVERFNKVGMAIDLAHVGDITSMEAIEYSKKPCLITHAGCRSLWDTKRMKNDEVLFALAEKGGVLGIEAAPHTTLSPAHPLHSLESVMDHFEKAVEIIGIDHVGFGPDTMFGDHVGMHHLFAKELGIHGALSSMKYQEVEFVNGLENPSDFPNIIVWLIKNGYSDAEIGKVMGGNVIRALKAIWPR